MKAAFKAALSLGLIAPLILGSAVHAAPSAGKSQQVGGRCFAHPKDLTLRGYLVAGEEHEFFNWTTNCTCTTSTSVTGSAWTESQLQQRVNGQWITLASGSYLFANIGPGTYRVIVKNTSQAPASYRIRHGHGIG